MQEFEAKTCPEQHLLDKVEGLHRQRDQLREALEIVLSATYGGEAAAKQKACPVYRAARAALKATEEG